MSTPYNWEPEPEPDDLGPETLWDEYWANMDASRSAPTALAPRRHGLRCEAFSTTSTISTGRSLPLFSPAISPRW